MNTSAEPISRALLKARGLPYKDFFGLSQAAYHELADLANYCESQLGIKTLNCSSLAPAGMRLELSGKRFSYSVRVTPYDGVSLQAGERVMFRRSFFNHIVAGQLARTIETEEKKWK